jgi:hypothetical protein
MRVPALLIGCVASFFRVTQVDASLLGQAGLAETSDHKFHNTSVCRAGPPQPAPPGPDKIHPQPTAVCDYDLSELETRIRSLFDGGASQLSVESVEKVFSIPPMTILSTTQKEASYTTIMSGSPRWTLIVWVREGFFPTDAGLPAFIPGPRPQRLARFDQTTAMLDLYLYRSDRSLGLECSDQHFTVDARTANWEDVTQRLVPNHGIPSPTFISPDGLRSVTITSLGASLRCGTSVAFRKPVHVSLLPSPIHARPANPSH